MKIKQNMPRAPFSRALVLIFLVLFISMGSSPGGALADNCQGGAGCFKCAELPHRHVPGTPADMEDSDCRTAGQDSTCGIQTGQIPDDLQGIVSTDRSQHKPHTGIFAPASDEDGQTRLAKAFVPPLLLSDSGGAVPIYLLNQSQLC